MTESPNNSQLSTEELQACLEALLFVATGPVGAHQLAEAISTTTQQVETGLNILAQTYQQGRGLRLQKHGDKYELTSSPDMAFYVEKFLGLEATARLSRAALETLSIVAYRQPITRPGIDAIRGVNSDGVLKSLLNKDLLQEIGRAEGPGRPILYGTTASFLQYFGLSSILELPPFELESSEVSEESRLLKE